MSRGRPSPRLADAICKQSIRHAAGPGAPPESGRRSGPRAEHANAVAVELELDLGARAEAEFVPHRLWNDDLSFRAYPLSHTKSITTGMKPTATGRRLAVPAWHLE